MAWKAGWTKAPADASLWNVILTSYEVLEAENMDLSEIEIEISQRDVMDDRSDDGRALTHYFNASSGAMDLKGELA